MVVILDLDNRIFNGSKVREMEGKGKEKQITIAAKVFEAWTLYRAHQMGVSEFNQRPRQGNVTKLCVWYFQWPSGEHDPPTSTRGQGEELLVITIYFLNFLHPWSSVPTLSFLPSSLRCLCEVPVIIFSEWRRICLVKHALAMSQGWYVFPKKISGKQVPNFPAN